MRVNRILLIAASAVSAIVVRPAQAQFGGGVFVCANCANEPTALKTSIIQDLERAQMVLQYAVELQQLADMIKNTIHGGPATLTNVSMDLNQLANVVQGGYALAYSLGNQDAVFRQTFPGYQSALGPPGMGTFQSKYAQWRRRAWTRLRAYCAGLEFRASCSRPNKEFFRCCGC